MSDVQQFQEYARQAYAAYSLAGAYWDDGALYSAADQMEEAARYSRAAQDARNRAMGVKDTTPTPTPAYISLPADLFARLLAAFTDAATHLDLNKLTVEGAQVKEWAALEAGLRDLIGQANPDCMLGFYRYPSDVAWAHPDGYAYCRAASAEAALQIAPDHITMANLQQLVDDCWRYVGGS
jgi:hypothetical protein